MPLLTAEVLDGRSKRASHLFHTETITGYISTAVNSAEYILRWFESLLHAKTALGKPREQVGKDGRYKSQRPDTKDWSLPSALGHAKAKSRQFREIYTWPADSCPLIAESWGVPCSGYGWSYSPGEGDRRDGRVLACERPERCANCEKVGAGNPCRPPCRTPLASLATHTFPNTM
ncbi:hypothetical protein EAI_06728 [Harpegnathos saltator]|uniref:Uncharacterized protein n=1 Tax=Harpegnathos saltator TaxID=610380 RepID=E2C9G9_HARSA|nr:hypothetical protein EAI_06728 [Harpegnathos saltator]